MQAETINETIEVIAHFSPGKINLLRFQWRGRAYRVRKTNHKWLESRGNDKVLHFTVVTDSGDTCNISFEFDRFVWKLDTVLLAG